jgi:C-terminal processing protease CtpA/Prc
MGLCLIVCVCASLGAFSPARSDVITLPQVTKLLPAGPAAESGNVEEGDLLHAVDGVDVRTWPLKKLANEKVPPFVLVLPVES